MRTKGRSRTDDPVSRACRIPPTSLMKKMRCGGAGWINPYRAMKGDVAANSSYTRESVSALFTGMLPSHAGATGWDAHPSDAFPTLAEVLRGAGYETAFLDLTSDPDARELRARLP